MRLNHLLLCLCLIIFCSCKTSKHTMVYEYKKGAEYDIPRYAKSILIVNNTGQQSPLDGHTIKYGDVKRKLYQPLDSLTRMLVSELAYSMNELGRFEKVLFDSISFRTDTLFLNKKEIAQPDMEVLARNNGVDLVLVLNRSALLSDLSVGGFEGSDFYQFLNNVRYQTDFKLYDSLTGNYIYDINSNKEWSFECVTKNEDLGFFETSIARNKGTILWDKIDQVMRSLFPYMLSETRIVFSTKDSNMKDAYNYARRNNWDDAAIIWEYLFKNAAEEQTKSYCAFNMAHYYERKNDLQEALNWLNKLSVNQINQDETVSKYLTDFSKNLKERIGAKR